MTDDTKIPPPGKAGERRNEGAEPGADKPGKPESPGKTATPAPPDRKPKAETPEQAEAAAKQGPPKVPPKNDSKDGKDDGGKNDNGKDDNGKGKSGSDTAADHAGAYDIVFSDPNDRERFNLKPKDRPAPIPEEQSEIADGIYETWGVLMYLRAKKVFERDKNADKSASDGKAYPLVTTYLNRLLDVAEVGLAANHVKTRLAARALEQIRQEIILRHGMAVKLRYLRNLGGLAVIGSVIGILSILIGSADWFKSFAESYLEEPNLSTWLPSYGWVIIGAMVGAWLSVAATRSVLAFNEMPEFVSSFREPSVRVLFVGILASVLALLIQVDVITFELGTLNLEEFDSKPGAALVIGLISGIAEKAISLRIIERMQKTVTTGNN